MSPTTLFYIIITILVIDFFKDQILSYLNASWYGKPIPENLRDVFDEEEYEKSQRYKRVNYRFGVLSGVVSFIAILAFLFLDGFAVVDQWAGQVSDHELIKPLIFFGILMLASDIISLPFSIYRTFVIEEKFGFNKTTPITFITDKLKGYLMGAIIGGGLLVLILLFYKWTGSNFWIYAWILVTVFTVFMNLFYSRLIVPLFNKQTPLEEGSLRTKIEEYATSQNFNLDKIFVIDGSKRSTKANAYFSGFGVEKRVVLYDTLIKELDEDEIVAVLAHEVGHYKRNHIIKNLVLSILLTGLTLWLFSLFVGSDLLGQALGLPETSFHIALVAFGLLYSPISELTGIGMSALSRKHEYEADNFASITYKPEPLISGLKKLSSTSLSNLTPHPAYEFWHYSHPSLAKRVGNLSS